MAATLTDAAGCWLVGWLVFARQWIDQKSARAVFTQMRAKFGRNSSLGLGQWLRLAGK